MIDWGDYMGYKILKKGILAIIFVLFLISIASSVNAETNDDNGTDILTVSKGGLVINYPSNWGYSESTSNDSIMAISKLDSIDSAGVGQVNINFEKRHYDGDFYTFVNDTYKAWQSDSSVKLVSSGGVLLGDRDAFEYVYTSNQNGVEREHKAVWFEKGGQAYVLLYSAPIDQFEANLYVFEYILTDIQIT